MAIKLNEITNFTHKKTAMLSGADFRFGFKVTSLEIHTNKKAPWVSRGIIYNPAALTNSFNPLISFWVKEYSLLQILMSIWFAFASCLSWAFVGR